MGMKEWYMDRMIGKMGPEKKRDMMSGMMDRFFESMSPEERKELMNAMMPRMMDKMFEGTSAEDRMDMMMTMMPKMMSRMFGGEEGAEGMPFRMPACGGDGGAEGSEAPEDFRPWECCPCRHVCEHGRKDREDAPPGDKAPQGAAGRSREPAP